MLTIRRLTSESVGSWLGNASARRLYSTRSTKSSVPQDGNLLKESLSTAKIAPRAVRNNNVVSPSLNTNTYVYSATRGFRNQLKPDTLPGGLKGNGVIAIRREDKNRWERRAPLAPAHVSALVSRGIQVIVQPSSRRVFSDEEYKQAGAIIQEDISPASTILGVKEVPRHLLIPERTYIFFSHTIKAQPYNMPLLDEINQLHIRLLDYERVVDDHNNRLIRFGKFAGYAGMIDFLHGLGNRLLAIGHSTPFLHLGYAHMYSGLENAFNAVFAMGREIANQGVPKELHPLVFVFSGTGASSQGAQEVFRMLPHKYISIDELPELCSNPNTDNKVVYAVVASSENYIVHKEGKKFTRKDYYAHPENYKSVFHEKIAPYTSCLINCVYWDVRYPRLLTTEQMEELERKKGHRLIGVADISCDVEGSVEFLKKTTTIDNPLFLYDVKNRKVYDEIDKKSGIMFLAVDNLPSELPKEASKYFGDHLMPWIEELAWSDGTLAKTDLPGELARATITSQGLLTKDYEYISELRASSAVLRKTNRILILGSGFVVAPIVDYLARFPRNYVTIASMDAYRADSISKGRMNVDTKLLDATNEDQLAKIIYSHDVVVSLVPAKLHPIVAKQCIELKKNMVTASYISPEMQGLDEQAKEKGVTILNEIGLDPGIDHLSALKIINDVRDKGGKIEEFISWCGGLPAPEASDNPLAYKFSWSPRGVLAALKNPACYRMKNETKEIASGSLLKSAQPVHVYTGFNLEGYPNRNSLNYKDTYDIPDASTILRGTLRYRGFSEFMQCIQDLGFFNEEPQDYLKQDAEPITWRSLVERVLEYVPSEKTLEEVIVEKLHLSEEGGSNLLYGLQWLGILSDEVPVRKEKTIIDSFCALLEDKLKYGEGERDLVILHHIFKVKWEDGREEKIYSTLVEYGDANGYSAMAKTVGIPTAIATKLLLDGTIIRKGVTGPFTPDIYVPLLANLEKEGISLTEKIVPLIQ